MKSTTLLSLALVMTISSFLLVAAAATSVSEIYDSRGGKLNDIVDDLNTEKGELRREEVGNRKNEISHFKLFPLSCKNLFLSIKADKRTFFVGSRYGRSQSDPTSMDVKSSSVRVVPRNDRYFFGSRYGKRSMMSPLMTSGLADDQNQSLSCFYTGVANLFRCVERSSDEMK